MGRQGAREGGELGHESNGRESPRVEHKEGVFANAAHGSEEGWK